MIEAGYFVTALRRAGLALFTGTPCSYLTPLINRVIDTPETGYVGATNEGDAVAIACGAELGGKPGVVLFQNSGLGNAVNPLTSLAIPFRIPVLVVTTWRGEPGGKPDEPQHELMGRITPSLLELMGIPWEVVPAEEEGLAQVLGRAAAHLHTARTPFGLILQEGAVAPCPLQSRPTPRNGNTGGEIADEGSAPPLDQDEALAALCEATGDADALLATTGFTGRALYALGDRPNQFYMVGSMGCVSSLGLGLALAQPHRRVVAIDGDGAMLMRLGAVATVGHERPANLVHVLLDNGVHESTGGQATVSPSVDLAAIARACGYPRVVRVADSAGLRAALAAPQRELTFIHVKTKPRKSRKLPRPTMGPAEVAERFREWLGRGDGT